MSYKHLPPSSTAVLPGGAKEILDKEAIEQNPRQKA